MEEGITEERPYHIPVHCEKCGGRDVKFMGQTKQQTLRRALGADSHLRGYIVSKETSRELCGLHAVKCCEHMFPRLFVCGRPEG